MAPNGLPEPILAEDAGTWWDLRTPEYRDAMGAWYASERIDINDLRSIEVYLVDVPFAVLRYIVRGDDGLFLVNEAGDDALTRAETRLLRSLPPAA